MPPGRRKSLETVPEQLWSQQSHGYKWTFKTLWELNGLETITTVNFYFKRHSLPTMGQMPTPFLCKVVLYTTGETHWHEWHSLVGLLTRFLNLGKDGRMILEVRVSPETCKMASSPPDFHGNIDWLFLVKIFVACQNQAYFAWCKSHWNQCVKILPTHLCCDNYTLPAAMKSRFWYMLLGSRTTQVS